MQSLLNLGDFIAGQVINMDGGQIFY